MGVALRGIAALRAAWIRSLRVLVVRATTSVRSLPGQDQACAAAGAPHRPAGDAMPACGAAVAWELVEKVLIVRRGGGAVAVAGLLLRFVVLLLAALCCRSVSLSWLFLRCPVLSPSCAWS